MNETATIPYEPQSDPKNNRDCGAACLSMVYASLGQPVQQTELWPAVGKENRFGSLASTTHLMAKDALERGFAALAFQARHPLQTLQQCRDLGVRAILNHRLTADRGTGHYSVLVDIDNEHVTLHDPYFGPSRQITHAELLELWQPHYPNSEVVGYMLIAIATPSSDEVRCELCHTSVPDGVGCPHCQEPVDLRPALMLRCVTRTCIARAWNYICCPSCDYTWTFNLPPANSAEAESDFPNEAAPTPPRPKAPEESDSDPWKLSAMFAKLDEFVSQVQAIPLAVSNPDVKKQLDFIIAGKEKLKLAQVEELANMKAHREKFQQLQAAAQQKAEEHRKKMAELNQPPAPLDPHALGRALLKNLGWES